MFWFKSSMRVKKLQEWKLLKITFPLASNTFQNDYREEREKTIVYSTTSLDFFFILEIAALFNSLFKKHYSPSRSVI